MTPLILLLFNLVLTALWPIVGQEGSRLFSGILFAHLGILIGFLSVLPWLTARGRWKRIVSPELRWPLFMVGFFGSGISNCLLITAVGYTTASNAAIMAQIEVIYSAVLCAWILRERIGVPQAAASLMVLGGTGLIMAHDLASPRWKGDLLVLATPWMYQVSHIFAKRLPKDLDEVTITGGRLFYGTLSLLPFSAWIIAHGARWTWNSTSVGLLLAQGIGIYSLSHFLWYVSIRRMDLAKATAIILSYPAFTVLFSWALGREMLHREQLYGLGLTLAGAYWLSMLVLRAGEQPTTETGMAEI